LVVVLALVCSSLVAGADQDGEHGGGHAHAPKHVTGTVKYPCGDPALTKLHMTPNGACGYEFAVNGGESYSVYPIKPADIDIHFVDAQGDFILQNAGSPVECGELHGTVVSRAVRAIVVTSPSGCSGRPGGSYDGSQVNVSFVYDD
jgi:hypothetical protein